MTSDRDVPSDEELRRLPRETRPPAELEARVVAALRAQGLLASGRRRRAARWLAAAAALTGFALGWSARGIPLGAPTPADEGPLFLLLLSPLPTPPDVASEASLVKEYRSWALELRRSHRLVRAEKLGEETRVLPGGGSSLGGASAADGPDASGFFLVRARSLDEAVALAQTCPHLRHGGRVTVRAIDPT